MRIRSYVLMTLMAVAIRLAVLLYFVLPFGGQVQADSIDYHQSAWCIAQGYGMRAPTGRPLFWRTPGYPAYLAIFYYYFGAHPEVKSVSSGQWYALVIQVLFCSLAPALIACLGFMITGSSLIVLSVGWISVFHPGFVLASTYLLTDGLALILFLLFLCCFFGFLKVGGLRALVGAACILALFTWVRPMGQLISLGVFLVLWCRSISWRRIGLFGATFGCLLAPWVVRNYLLTGEFFFCPLTGLYLNAFSAPKIVARSEHISLKDAHAQLKRAAARAILERMRLYQSQGVAHFVCGETISGITALPHLVAHPWWALCDWMTEVFKTIFDLYSSQLVAIIEHRAHYDPLIEYLGEKTIMCLRSASRGIRIMGLMELFYAFFVWLGLLGGFCFSVVPALWGRFTRRLNLSFYIQTWLTAALFFVLIVGPTGGYGYARLRIPAEPLMLIYATLFWISFFRRTDYHETTLCSVAE